ncbi:MAG: carbon-nitrogen hydrolase family protein [Thermoflexales bacterium]|nr:carbon-nitrogen hydrolase family protein [Thermoflexales bacterium]
MRVGLVPLKTEARNPAANLERLAQRLAEIAPHQLDLVCLPECTLTGYIYDEDDLKQFGEPIPGPVTDQLGQLAKRYAIYLCFGMIEAAASGVYDAAVLLDRTGQVVLKHRKIEEKPPFANGKRMDHAETDLGRLGILICGDLFNSAVVRRLEASLRVLILPISRSFDGRSPDVERWLTKERLVYLEAAKATGVTTLIVNALEINSAASAFGGAMIVNAHGELLAESPHGTDEVVVWDFAEDND